MLVNGKKYRSIWRQQGQVKIIDQTLLPHRFSVIELADLAATEHAIRTMQVRGAPLIGATAAYGMALAAKTGPSDDNLQQAAEFLIQARPTAVNLKWAVDQMIEALTPLPLAERAEAGFALADEISEQDIATNHTLGRHGLKLIEQLSSKKNGAPVNILTHCNAGWLATVDWGTATSPIYQAHDAGIAVHVWVDETRPRNQGASLTTWELQHHGVPHTLVVDNAGGHLMQHGLVDLCLTGTDRTTASGDVCNKIGTYLKALAAKDNNVPFYVALPSPTIDWTITDGLSEIPIERRHDDEITMISGLNEAGKITTVKITPPETPVANYAFDVTPARMISALITERGICEASRQGLAGLFPERAGKGDAS